MVVDSCYVPRNIFVASPGFILLSADYSQIEVRLLAHYSNDQRLIDVFREHNEGHLLSGDGSSGRHDTIIGDKKRIHYLTIKGRRRESNCNFSRQSKDDDFFQRLARQWLRSILQKLCQMTRGRAQRRCVMESFTAVLRRNLLRKLRQVL